MNSQKMMEIAVKAADAKRANDIVVLNMSQASLLADYFVIASADNQRQLAAIVDNIVEQEENAQVSVNHLEGQKDSNWILVDLNDVVVHVFTNEARDFYKLEKLWSNAPLIDVTTLLS
ncbi:ribosome silencing factor [Bombilactobacillus thymidiniphilus]|uniref:Ribosomal silencing factor RsfS n=1 Tax=Bombilactobacillus thymidiniphilus TaxID=2923363 RepID=A0ABY4PCI8_9LACO|nr:ribosome silencing factor [Bombilactobacillus thymidiniphilus]UQS83369.1 ribosome silencing factor [Bombilactobacillus thymidiniphilus]